MICDLEKNNGDQIKDDDDDIRARRMRERD
jgi:hypothetical protein